MKNLYTSALVLVLSPPLLADPISFTRKADIPGKTADQILTILNDYANVCDHGCKYPAKDLASSEILEQTADHILAWQEFKGAEPASFFREITIERSAEQIVLRARFPDAGGIAASEQHYGKKHSTPLAQLNEEWILKPGNLLTSVSFSGSVDSPVLSEGMADIFAGRIDTTFATLKRPLDFALFDHTIWRSVAVDQDVFPRNETHKTCPQGTWAVEADAVEIKTGACNFLTLTQPLPVKIPAGTKLRFVMWHNDLTAKAPAAGHVGLALNKKILWQETIAIPSEPRDYEAVITLVEALEAGAPMDVHIDNHGTNAWTIYSLEWIP